MHSLLLRVMTELLWPLMTLFSLFVLFRGHQYPGGGFVGGLTGAATIGLWTLAHGADHAEERLPIVPEVLAAAGLAVATLAALLPIALGEPVLAHVATELHLGLGVRYTVSTSLLFDLGVYAIVLGVVVAFIWRLEQGPSAMDGEGN